jgi:chromosome segregation ATPase
MSDDRRDLFVKFLAEADRAADLNKTLMGDPKRQPETFTDLILDIAVRQSQPSSRRPTATSLSYERRLILAALHIAIQDLRANREQTAKAEDRVKQVIEDAEEKIDRVETDLRRLCDGQTSIIDDLKDENRRLKHQIDAFDTSVKSKQDDIDRLTIQIETTQEAQKKETERQEITLKALRRSEEELKTKLKEKEERIASQDDTMAEQQIQINNFHLFDVIAPQKHIKQQADEIVDLQRKLADRCHDLDIERRTVQSQKEEIATLKAEAHRQEDRHGDLLDRMADSAVDTGYEIMNLKGHRDQLLQSETALKSTIQAQQEEIDKLKSIVDEHHLERTFMTTLRKCLNEAEIKADAANRRAKELEHLNTGWQAKYEDVRDKLVVARQDVAHLLRTTQDTVQRMNGASNKRIKTR